MLELFRPLLAMYVLSWIFLISQVVLGIVVVVPALCGLSRKPNAFALFGMGWHSVLAIAFASLSAMVVVATQGQSHFGWWYYPTTFIFFGSLLAGCYPTNGDEADAYGGAAILTGLISFVVFCAWPTLLNSVICVDCARWADWFLSGWWTRGWVGTVLLIFVLGRFVIFAFSVGIGVLLTPILATVAFVTGWRELAASKRPKVVVEVAAKRAA
jgi:hypothetical protein